mmetsp:Transcript_15833/g.23979  ORF Transcript_15833/g.23979 Transcript_15833/m.23979 type:complete len:553 (-) Transcript_15833:244-1902(-)
MTILRILLLLLALKSSSAGRWEKLLSRDKESARKATACDTQMARSLVSASEEKEELTAERDQARTDHKLALDEIERMTKELEDNKLKLTNRIVQLGNELEESKGEAESTISELTKKLEDIESVVREESKETIAKLGKDLEESKENTEAIISKMTKERQDSESAIKEDSKAALADLREKFDKALADSEEKVSKVEKQYSDFKEQKEKEIESIHEERSKEKEKVVKELMGKKERITKDHQKEKKELERNHSKMVNELKMEMETKEKEAMDHIKSREIELEKKMNKLQLEARKVVKEKEGNYSKQVKELMASIETLQRDHSQLEEHITDLEMKYADASKEIEEWQATFNARSYCNLTHIQEDATATMTAAAAAASKIAAEQAATATRAASKAAEPHIEAGRKALNKLYDENLKETVDKHISPVHEAHIRPTVSKISEVANSGFQKAKELAAKARRRSISEFKDSCIGFKAHLRQANFPKVVRDFVRQKCKEPEQTIDRFLLAILLFFVIIFRKFLWRTTKRILYFPFRVLWYCTPLPLLFGRKNNTPSVPVKAEQ